jgi:O-antigen ligase
MNVKKYAAPNGALYLVLMRLQLWRTYGAKVMEKFFRLIKIILPLAIVTVCLFGYVLHSQSGIFREFQAALLSVEWMLLACLAIWCLCFIFLTFSLKDLPLVGLLLIAIIAYFISKAASWKIADAVILLAGVTLGKGAGFFVGDEVTSLNSKPGNKLETPYVVSYFLIGLIILLAFSSWWHLDMSSSFYHGPRWMGLWDNPNIYGMLMGAGVTLAIGLLAASLKSKVQSPKSAESAEKNKVMDARSLSLRIILFIAAGMMGVGLFFSYSRGAWVGTAVGLLYLAKASGKAEGGKRKAKIIWYLAPIVVIASAVVVVFFWHNTADTDAWYLKRLDLSRPSAQHRVSAWRGALQMMRDHPFGVGWNNAVGVYEKDYSPPEGGAAALTTNSYLMLGTELGLPGLVYFIAYVWLLLRGRARHSVRAVAIEESGGQGTARPTICAACRAGAVVLLVAFWFDGGLFTLATASVFWILLELGANAEGRMKNEETRGKAESGIRKAEKTPCSTN